MEDQLSIWTLVSEASLLVQLVMLSLLMASVVSWTMIVRRLFVYREAEIQLSEFGPIRTSSEFPAATLSTREGRIDSRNLRKYDKLVRLNGMIFCFPLLPEVVS